MMYLKNKIKFRKLLQRQLKVFLLVVSVVLCSAFAQGQQVTGMVTDESGVSLPGVTIIEKGTSNGATTDFDGKYTINISSDRGALVFSYIGFVTKEIQVSGKTNINIALKEDLQNLDEIVVIGYGTSRKGDLTGAITTVSGKDFDKVAASSPLQILQGRAAGLNITSSSGLPGAGSNVLVRGVGSINGTSSPIYVVDGVIKTSINNLNPNTIESVSVLKDASAAAIYGARAANGVILVTTKRGKGKMAPEINFNAFYSVQGESNLRLNLLNAEQFLTLWTESHENIGLTPNWTQADIDAVAGVDTNWKDEMLQTGTIANYDVSVSGGNENSNYFVALNSLNQEGISIGTAFNKLNLTLNSDHKINKWLKFGNSILLYSSKREGSGGYYGLALRKSPLTRVYEDDGRWGIIRSQSLEHIHQNPLWQAKNFQNDTKTRGLQGNLYLTLNLLKGLEFTARGSVDYENRYKTNFVPGVLDPAVYSWEGTTTNSVSKEATNRSHWIADFLLNYKITLNDNHNISALLGHSIEENEYELLSGSVLGTPNNSIRFLDAGDPESQLNSNSFSDWSFSSIFGRVGYNYKNKYFVNGSIRRDGTSRLTEENRYGVFPSASVGWKISEEDFFNTDGFISSLKLRASIGILGNVLSIGEYATTSVLNSRGAVLNQGLSAGFTQTAAVNQDITWEKSKKSNFGLDALLANGMIYTSVDYFVEETTDQLFEQPIPSSNGFSSNPRVNSGAIKNTGFELQLGFRDNKSKDWSYDVNFNLSTVKNQVSDLGGRDDEFLTRGLKVGEPVNSFFGYQTNGLITDASQLDKYQAGSFGSKEIGDIDIVDTNTDGVINADDRTIIGNRFADFTYGMLGTVNYKNWGFQVQLQGVQGRDIYIGGRNSSDLMVLMSSWARNEDARVFNRYHPVNNPNGTWPRVTKDNRGSNLEVSDFWLEDGSFLRISNINLSYNLPTEILSEIGINSLSVYGSIFNAYTFTKYDGPEVDTTAGGPSSRRGLSGVPSPRTFTLGLKASF